MVRLAAVFWENFNQHLTKAVIELKNDQTVTIATTGIASDCSTYKKYMQNWRQIAGYDEF